MRMRCGASLGAARSAASRSAIAAGISLRRTCRSARATQRGQVVRLESECLVEVGQRQVRLPVAPMRQAPLVEVTRLSGGELAGARQVGNGMLKVMT